MKKILLIILIAISLPSFAILETKKINLKNAIEIALLENPQIKISKLEVDIKRNEIKIANRLNNPSLASFQNMGTGGRGEPNYVGGDIIIDILKRGKRKKTAKLISQSAYDNQKFLEYHLIYEIKKAYIDFLLKKSNYKIIKEQEALSKELLDCELKEEKLGHNKNTDVLQAKIAYNRALMYSNIAKSEVITSQNRFNTIMNSSSMDYDTLEDDLDDNYESLMTINPKDDSLDFEDIKNYALSNRYDYLMSQKEVEIAQNQLKEIKAKMIPDLELQAGYQFRPRGGSNSHTLENGSYIGANIVNIPLLYRYQPEIKNAKLKVEQLQLKNEDIRIDIIRDITDAFEKYTIARNNLNFYNKELLLNSKELLKESYKSLNKNEIDLTSFLVSKKLYLELILGYNEALAEYYISYAELLCQMNAKDFKFQKL